MEFALSYTARKRQGRDLNLDRLWGPHFALYCNLILQHILHGFTAAPLQMLSRLSGRVPADVFIALSLLCSNVAFLTILSKAASLFSPLFFLHLLCFSFKELTVTLCTICLLSASPFVKESHEVSHYHV